MLGFREGPKVGKADGKPEGKSVGGTDSRVDGTRVGKTEGPVVGLNVGVWEGEADGAVERLKPNLLNASSAACAAYPAACMHCRVDSPFAMHALIASALQSSTDLPDARHFFIASAIAAASSHIAGDPPAARHIVLAVEASKLIGLRATNSILNPLSKVNSPFSHIEIRRTATICACATPSIWTRRTILPPRIVTLNE